MPGKIFLDSNISLYILDKSSLKFNTSKQLLQNRPHISTQVVAENINVCIKKFKLSRDESIKHAESLMQACVVHGITNSILKRTLQIMDHYGYSVFDSQIIASALGANCNTLYSEDLNHGQVVDDTLKIINPFVSVMQRNL